MEQEPEDKKVSKQWERDKTREKKRQDKENKKETEQWEQDKKERR